MKTLGLALLGFATFGTACVAQDDGGGGDIDQAQLELYRSAIPSRARLEAPRATATTATLLGEPAEYPRAAAPVVLGINGTVGLTVGLLEFVTSFPPTVYNSETLEFVWGPFPDDQAGYMAAYIKDTQGEGDFQFEYALLRGASNDLATLTPIIYGAGTPDPNDEDHGVGVTVWDMTANKEFLSQHDPNFDASQHDSGRFAALFGRGVDENDADAENTFVVAAFRDFVSKDEPDNAPVDLDYLYGRHTNGTETIDFVDIEAGIDVSEPADGTQEDIGLRLAFFNQGTGRAEADAVNGSLDANQSYSAVECWDTSLNRTFAEGVVDDNGTPTTTLAEGEASSCGAFEPSLDDLGIPRLENIDAELLAALDEVATNGLPE